MRLFQFFLLAALVLVSPNLTLVEGNIAAIACIAFALIFLGIEAWREICLKGLEQSIPEELSWLAN